MVALLGHGLQLPDLMVADDLFTLSLCDVELSVDAIEEGLTSSFITFSHTLTFLFQTDLVLLSKLLQLLLPTTTTLLPPPVDTVSV